MIDKSETANFLHQWAEDGDSAGIADSFRLSETKLKKSAIKLARYEMKAVLFENG